MIRAHNERCENLVGGIFEIRTFYGNIAFPLASALSAENIFAAAFEKIF